MANIKIAVILSGNGVYDGAEIHESVLTLLAITPAEAADVSLRTVLLAPNVSSSTGDITNDGVSIQFSGTVGERFGAVYAYAGFFADYSFEQADVTEIDPFVGVSFTTSGNIQVGASVTLVHNLNEPVSLAGNLTLSRTFAFGDEISFTPRAAWKPQWVFDGVSGSYFEAGTRFEWRPTELPDWKFVLDSSVVYDTGAYGASEGVSFHLEPKLRWRATDWLDLEMGPELHWSKTGEFSPTFLFGWTLNFSP